MLEDHAANSAHMCTNCYESPATAGKPCSACAQWLDELLDRREELAALIRGDEPEGPAPVEQAKGALCAECMVPVKPYHLKPEGL